MRKSQDSLMVKRSKREALNMSATQVKGISSKRNLKDQQIDYVYNQNSLNHLNAMWKGGDPNNTAAKAQISS